MYNEAEEGRDFQHCEWEEQPDGYRDRWRRSAARLLADVVPLIRAHIADQARAQALREAADEIHREARWQKESQTRGMFANGETSVDRLLMLERIMRLAATGTPWTMLQHASIVFGADETDPSDA